MEEVRKEAAALQEGKPRDMKFRVRTEVVPVRILSRKLKSITHS